MLVDRENAWALSCCFHAYMKGSKASPLKDIVLPLKWCFAQACFCVLEKWLLPDPARHICYLLSFWKSAYVENAILGGTSFPSVHVGRLPQDFTQLFETFPVFRMAELTCMVCSLLSLWRKNRALSWCLNMYNVLEKALQWMFSLLFAWSCIVLRLVFAHQEHRALCTPAHIYLLWSASLNGERIEFPSPHTFL